MVFWSEPEMLKPPLAVRAPSPPSRPPVQVVSPLTLTAALPPKTPTAEIERAQRGAGGVKVQCAAAHRGRSAHVVGSQHVDGCAGDRHAPGPLTTLAASRLNVPLEKFSRLPAPAENVPTTPLPPPARTRVPPLLA